MFDTYRNLNNNVQHNMDAIQKAITIFLSDRERYDYLIEDILMQISDISDYLYSNPEIVSKISSGMDDMKKDHFMFIRFVEEWMSETQIELKKRFECDNKLDYDFWCFISHIRHSSKNMLKEEIITGFRFIKDNGPEGGIMTTEFVTFAI